MAKKLSIVISGAVSLGSYEAGVMYEVLEAIAKHNEAAGDSNDRIEIDLITGASAGGMTACILAQNLLFDDGSMRLPYGNALYKAWVEMVDILPLLDLPEDQQKKSLLSVEVINRIASTLLVDDQILIDKIKADPGALSRHPSAAENLLIGVAMSNLNGYNFSIPTTGNKPFTYTRFKDQLICRVDRDANGGFRLREMELQGGGNGQDQWEPGPDMSWSLLREAGISSGAFPLAFPLRLINRDELKGRFSQRNGPVSYTDGGVFENEPIGMAHSILDHPADADRYCLLVKPGPRSVSPNLSVDEDLLKTLKAVVGAVVQQAQFQDFIMKEAGENNRLMTITSENTVLVGDILSAFSGFLEQKFRAYDYNIGRETARRELSRAAGSGLLRVDPSEPGVMPPIDWVVGEHNPHDKECNRSFTLGRDLTSWVDAKALMSEIATSSGAEGGLDDLHRLMHEVSPKKRKVIADQLCERLENLIDYVNESYLAKADEDLGAKVDEALREWMQKYLGPALAGGILGGLTSVLMSQNVLKRIRERAGMPLIKLIANNLLQRWLKAHIINPPSPQLIQRG
jgi:hypothetical protein